MMKLYILTILLLLFLGWLLRRYRSHPFSEKGNLPYRKKNIMTPPEMEVYAKLLEILPDYMIFPQVQASRVLATPENDYYWFNFISRLSYDFVICRTDGTPLAAIELDDRSHLQAKRQEADQRKNRATQAADIAMIRWNYGAMPSEHEMIRMIKKIDRNTD